MNASTIYIEGTWREAAEGGTIPVVNPSTGEVFAHISRGTAREANDAVIAARRAFPTW